MKRIALLLASALMLPSLSFASGKPYGLMTDLIERTDVVYSGGYPSSMTLGNIPETAGAVQFAAIFSDRPNLSWIMDPGNASDVLQTAYRIVVERFDEKWQTVWDSGKVESGLSSSVPYGGPALAPSTTYRWQVMTWDNHGVESGFSDFKEFRTAQVLDNSAVSTEPVMKTDQRAVSIERMDDGNWFLDFGKDAFGQLRVTLSSACNGEKVVLHLGERLDGSKVNRTPPGTCRYRRIELSLLEGIHTYNIDILPDFRNTHGDAVLMPDYIGEVVPFRYVEVEGYKGELHDTDVIRMYAHHPFDRSCSYFHCSDESINELWELCKYTMEATSFIGYHIDGDRERIPYECDALINQLAYYAADRSYTLSRRTADYLLDHPTWPTEWILQTVLVAWNDYLHTGDTRLLESRYELLGKHTLSDLMGENCLVSTRAGEYEGLLKEIKREYIRDIVDWPQGHGSFGLEDSNPGETDYFEFKDYNTVVNAYFYRTLVCMASIADALGKPDEEARWKSLSDKVRSQFNKLLSDKKTHLYVDGVGSAHSALHSNMFPLAFGIVPEKQIESVGSFVQSRGMACSIANSKFLMDALYNAGNADYALQLLQSKTMRSWYNTILAGATMTLEAWDDRCKPNQDWNHAWGACLGDILPHRLMGVRPLSPAWNLVEIKPQISSLGSAECIVPTIKGQIEVAVSRKDGTLKVSVPANTCARVYVPADLALGTSRKHVLKMNGNDMKAALDRTGKFFVVDNVGSGEKVFTVK